jgi:hypothetical protein
MNTGILVFVGALVLGYINKTVADLARGQNEAPETDETKTN